MSSSSPSKLIRRPELVDLRRQQPAVPAGQFSEQIEFEKVASSRTLELTPDEAYRNGLAEGEKLGRAATLKEISPVLDELRAFARGLAIVREQRLMELEGELLDVATELARRILRAELETSTEAAARLARACIEEAAGQKGLVLRAAAADLERVRRYVADLELDLADGGICVEADADLPRGAVVLHTPLRVYDGRPERLLGAARLRAEQALRSLP
jgi:flagellar biosynthesis/type III secretory pathway protein FliH